jgi:hypothetical protein
MHKSFHFLGAAFSLALVMLLFKVSSGLSQRESKKPLIDAESPTNCVWAAAAVVPIPILDEAAAAMGSNIFTFCGISNGVPTANCYKFDGTTWTAIAPYPAVAVEFASAVSDGTFVYIMNGARSGNIYTTDVFRYDPASDTYTQLASNTVGTWNQTAVFFNGKIYKMGGNNTGGYQTALEIYDIATNTWTLGAPLPTAAGFASSWVQGNFIYIAGGINVTGVGGDKTYRYDPAGNIWNDAAIADLPTTRWGAAYVFYSDSVVLAGGYVGGDVTANISTSAIYYNAATDTWIALPNMIGERARMNGAVLGGSFYVVGGRSIASPLFNGTDDNQKLTCQFTAPVPQLAVSRKTHGGVGTFDINLPLTGTPGTECRSGVVAGAHQMIITFAGPVTVSGVAVTTGTGSATFSVSGAVVTVDLTGITNAQTITVTLNNVSDGVVTGNVPVSMGVLSGDTNANRTVNAGDVAQTKGQAGQPVTGANFRTDVNSNGSINAGDVALVKSRAGTSLP